MFDWTGETIDRYIILEKLGEGGMAAVFKAHDSRLDRDVAIKIIRTDTYDTKEFFARFEREAKALAKLQHPNIVNVIDYGDHEGIPFLVMDFIPGGTLKDRIGQPTSFKDAALILAPISRALEYAHKKGIIHRDIKPQNIMITESGDPMLTDFGIAKILGGEEVTELTKTGLGFGTPGYMAPEQLLGAKADKRLDIYNLGIVFYEHISGRKPFRVSDLSEMLLQDDEEIAEHLKRFLPYELPPKVFECLTKALAKNPEDRYQEMGEFAKALEQFSRFEARRTEPLPKPSQPPQTGRFASLPSWAKSGMLAGGILSITVIIAAWITYAAITRFNAQNFTPAEENRVSTNTPPAPTVIVQSVQPEAVPVPIETIGTSPASEPTLQSDQPQSFVSDIDDMQLIFIPEGEFEMGYGSGNADESPAHNVFLDAYWIDQTEVSNKQYAACVASGDCPELISKGSFARPDYFTNPQYTDYPVIYINYEQAQAYCSWAGRRLPTEAEWEKAARGTERFIYPWGNTAPSPDLLNYDRNVGDTTAVGSYPAGASPYGVLDMSGNVSEWVADWYDAEYYIGSLRINPPGPVNGIERVLRGGNWEDTNINHIRAIDRMSRLPQARSERYIGFRCAVSE